MNANDWNFHFQRASNGKCTFKVVEPELGNIKNTDELILKLAEIDLKYAVEVAKDEIAFCKKALNNSILESNHYPNISQIMCKYYREEIQKYEVVFQYANRRSAQIVYQCDVDIAHDSIVEPRPFKRKFEQYQR